MRGEAGRGKRVATWVPGCQESGVEAVTGPDIEDDVDRNGRDTSHLTVSWPRSSLRPQKL